MTHFNKKGSTWVEVDSDGDVTVTVGEVTFVSTIEGHENLDETVLAWMMGVASARRTDRASLTVYEGLHLA